MGGQTVLTTRTQTLGPRFNNHGGKHTWIRQPASYLKSGACRGCWQWPGNGNSADTKGVTVGELAAGSLGGKNGDGSVVKIHFPTYHDMLKVRWYAVVAFHWYAHA